jgi:hypothetical protein
MVILERSPFPSAFTITPSLDDPYVSDRQFMTATFVAGELPGLVFVHAGLLMSIFKRLGPAPVHWKGWQRPDLVLIEFQQHGLVMSLTYCEMGMDDLFTDWVYHHIYGAPTDTLCALNLSL